MSVGNGWTVTRTEGDAGPFHARPVPAGAGHEVWIHDVRRPALVLGSTQSPSLLDTARAAADGVEVCKRRSGGGIVPLTPGEDCWLDVIVPRRSPLWDDDVGRAFDWLGRAWAITLDGLRPTSTPSRAAGSPSATEAVEPGPEVYAGPLQGGSAGRLICFASLGPGEVTVGANKVVGISQRRTRDAARFQCVAVGRWRPDLLTAYVAADALADAGVDPTAVVAGLPPEAGHWAWPAPAALAAALCANLPPLGDADPTGAR